MTSTPSVFLLGATGYVGGSLLVTLLKEYPSATFTGLVRNSKSAEAVKAVSPDRINTILGTHSDASIIEAEIGKADITINAASCDDMELMDNIINGFKKKSQKGILIHTRQPNSGSAVILADDIKGPFPGKLDERGSKIWDDTKTEDLRAIPPHALHRPAEIAVIEAHDQGILDGYIICPGLIYGPGIGPVKTTSIQIPLLLQVALRRRQVFFAGDGSNIWCNIHLQDLIQIYTHVINHALSVGESANKVDPYSNYYFAASSENSIKEIANLIAATLHSKGLVDSPDARGLSPEDPDENLVAMVLGHTSRAVSVRAKNLGWSPVEKKITETGVIGAEIENILKTTQATS
ncbi:hypothetical protein RSOLAG22IIIB_04082 [Rhizoctonia solani]|uniref:NAD(P)-binding domain-containing protein n=1 Tax=Rhizoctonia solani TaxID=456999 RepID=A0A0K6FUH7_9AGAM|nr:hypothetical protein RSOLAG22IIIB_04082 [Rhizoctonia solani]